MHVPIEHFLQEYNNDDVVSVVTEVNSYQQVLYHVELKNSKIIHLCHWCLDVPSIISGLSSENVFKMYTSAKDCFVVPGHEKVFLVNLMCVSSRCDKDSCRSMNALFRPLDEDI